MTLRYRGIQVAPAVNPDPVHRRQAYGMIIAQMAHAGDGNAHPHLLYYPDEEGIQNRIHDTTAEIFPGSPGPGRHHLRRARHRPGERCPLWPCSSPRADLDFMARVRHRPWTLPACSTRARCCPRPKRGRTSLRKPEIAVAPTSGSAGSKLIPVLILEYHPGQFDHQGQRRGPPC